VCARIHLHVHLQAIYADTYSASSIANRDCYFHCNSYCDCHGDFYSHFQPNHDSTTKPDGYFDTYAQANADA
jgi:hypothetical protein